MGHNGVCHCPHGSYVSLCERGHAGVQRHVRENLATCGACGGRAARLYSLDYFSWNLIENHALFT